MTGVFRFLILALVAFSNLAVFGSEEGSPFPEIVSHEMGEVLPRRKVTWKLLLKNGSDAARDLLSVKAGCDCITVLKFPHRLEAHETGEMELEFLGQKAGRFDVDLQVAFRNGTSGPAGTELHSVGGTVADLRDRYLVQPRDVRTEKERPVFIDVRPQRDFQQIHIQDSINLPAYVVQTRVDLRERPIVLVHDGVVDAQMLDRCADLEAKGFVRVKLLAGGIQAWRANRGPVEMAPGPKLTLAFITPDMVSAFASEAGGAIVYLTQGLGKVDLAGLEVRLLPMRRFESMARTVAGRPLADGKVPHKILFITDHGGDYPQIEFGRSGYSPAVFVLSGGLEAYRAWKNSPANSFNPKQLTLRTGSEVRMGQSLPIPGRIGCRTCPK